MSQSVSVAFCCFLLQATFHNVRSSGWKLVANSFSLFLSKKVHSTWTFSLSSIAFHCFLLLSCVCVLCCFYCKLCKQPFFETLLAIVGWDGTSRMKVACNRKQQKATESCEVGFLLQATFHSISDSSSGFVPLRYIGLHAILNARLGALHLQLVSKKTPA